MTTSLDAISQQMQIKDWHQPSSCYSSEVHLDQNHSANPVSEGEVVEEPNLPTFSHAMVPLNIFFYRVPT